MGASILPITIHKGKIIFLFGKERSIDENTGWSDFGGGTDANESFIETACREGAEEITGFLGNKTDIKKMMRRHGTYNIDYEGNNKYGTYRCHICPVIYDEYLTEYYNNNQRFLQKHLDKKVIKDTKIFEKAEIKWFSFDDLKKNKKQFRNFYQNIVDLILQHRSHIEQFIRSKSNKLKSNKTKRRRNKKPRKTRKTHR